MLMSHAERICDRILLIAKGRKIFDGTIHEARLTIPNRVRACRPRPMRRAPAFLAGRAQR